jgi:large repetitive protein
MKTTRRSLATKTLYHLRGFWKRRKEASLRCARRGFFFEPLENRSLLAGDLASHFSVTPEGEGENTNPTFLAISNQAVLQGAPLWLGIDGSDAESNPITYTVTSSNPGVVAVTVPTGNKTLVLNVANFGTMKFQLFDNLAPRAATAIESLATSGFYNGLTFHRILNDFIIQGGAADGAGGPNPNVADFDDQYNADLQFTSPGLLAMAKGQDDTNDTQFFVTDTVNPPTTSFPRHLDFNHTIFGKLTEGEAVRQAISNVTANGSGVPTTPVVITSATILNSDPENGAFMLKALAGSGTSQITVTANDGQGGTFSRTFQATVAADTSNSNPFLAEIPTVQATVGASTVTFPLQGTDVEGDAIFFDATKIGSVNYTVSIDHNTNIVTVTPPAGFIGNFQVQVSAKALAQQNTPDSAQSITDVQKVTVRMVPVAPVGLDLAAASDTGASNTDNITKATSLDFQVSGVTNGAVIRLYDGNNVLAQTTATGTTATLTFNNIAVLSEGAHNFTVTQAVSGEESLKSAPLSVTYDATLPGAFTSTAPTSAEVGTLYSYDAQNAAPNTGVIYSLSPALTGASINSSTGVVSWTPAANQVGPQTFGIVASDLAGNTVSQSVNVTVVQPVTKVAELVLSITDLNQNPISTLHVGNDFLLRGSTRDLRPTIDAKGVFALFADLNYDSTKVQVTGNVQFNGGYVVATSGTTTTAGLVDELGAVSSNTVPINTGLKLMFEIPMKVLAGGQLSFTTDPAELLPSHDVLLFGQDPPVSSTAVKYGSLSISVDTTFSAVSDTLNASEDSTNNSLTVLANDTIAPGSGNILTISAVGATDRSGTVTISGDAKTLLYTPAPNFNGSETFTYTVKNQLNETSTATVTMQVAPVNDPPTAGADTFTVAGESTNNVLNVLANDSASPDTGETLTVSAVTQGNQGGTLQLGAGGSSVRYTPAPNFEGTETFSYTLSDGKGGTAQATATVTVTHTNHNPVATADTLTVVEDSGATTVNVLANDNDGVDTGETLTITSVGTPTKGGVVTLAANKLSVSYTPAPNFQGIETFTYVLSDGNGGTATGTATITVTNVNDPPTATTDTLTGFKNTANVFNVLANDLFTPDPSETFTITSVTQPAHGTLSITSNGTRVTYIPATDYTGADSFTYTMQDPGGLSATATANVTVQNFIPSELAGRVFIDVNGNGVLDSLESGIENVEIKLTGTDAGGLAVSRSAFTQFDGSYTFENLVPGNYSVNQVQPAFLRNGSAYAGTQWSAVTANQEITGILPQNRHSVGNNFSELGKPRNLTRIEEFFATNIGHNVLTAATFTGNSLVAPQWRAVAGSQWSQFHDFRFALTNSGKSLQIEVKNAQNQLLRATISASDTNLVLNLGQQANGARLFKLVGDPANFHFALVPNVSPAAAADAVSLAIGATVNVNVLANDTDADGTLNLGSLAITQAPAHGTATKNSDGTVTYVHGGSAGTTDSFRYTIADNTGAVSNTATVSITITPANQAPVAVNDTATLAEGATSSINVSTNDTDADGTLNLASLVITQNPANGSATVNANGTVSYTHNGSETTSDSFRYTIKDNTGAVSGTATVAITVLPVNDPPVAVNDTATLNEGGTAAVNVATNDTDVDGTINPATIIVTQAPANGTATANANGTVTYTHNGSETTGDSFRYTIKDNTGAVSGTATVAITLTPVNDAPVAIFNTATVNEGSSVVVDVATNDIDVDGTIDIASIVVTQNPAHGTVTVHNDGKVTYTHDGSETTSDTFTYTIKDNQGVVCGAAASVLITVTPVNDAPLAVNDSATVAPGANATINVATNDTDADGTINPASIVIIQQPTHGTVTVNANGTVSYQHDNSPQTTDSFTYKINDNLGTQSAAAALVSIAIGSGEGEADLFGGLSDDTYHQAVDSVLAEEEDWMN